jgi:outer membrane lipoprotein-sorting protein
MKKTLLILASLFVLITLSGCGEETAGDKLDKAVDSTKEATSNALDSIKKAVE